MHSSTCKSQHTKLSAQSLVYKFEHEMFSTQVLTFGAKHNSGTTRPLTNAFCRGTVCTDGLVLDRLTTSPMKIINLIEWTETCKESIWTNSTLTELSEFMQRILSLELVPGLGKYVFFVRSTALSHFNNTCTCKTDKSKSRWQDLAKLLGYLTST